MAHRSMSRYRSQATYHPWHTIVGVDTYDRPHTTHGILLVGGDRSQTAKHPWYPLVGEDTEHIPQTTHGTP